VRAGRGGLKGRVNSNHGKAHHRNSNISSSSNLHMANHAQRLFPRVMVAGPELERAMGAR
jgi:hypothetical protein